MPYPAIPNLAFTGPNHQVTFVIFTGIILNFASRQVIISFILGIAMPYLLSTPVSI